MVVGRYIPDELPDEFWRMIEQACQSSAKLREILEDKDRDAIVRFVWNYDEAVAHIQTEFPSTDDFSEDSIDEMCAWIVAQGREYYKKIWDHPELMAAYQTDPAGSYKMDPGLASAAMLVHKARYGEEVPYNESQDIVV